MTDIAPAPMQAIVCFDSDILPWEPCADHTWYRYGPTIVCCENCDYSAYVPSPIAGGWTEPIDDDLIPNPPRPKFRGKKP